MLDDTIGLQLAAPNANWRERPDMHPQGTRGYRASIVARARFVDDLVEAPHREGIAQYVIPGAGLDTFAQRKPEIAQRMRIFEVDRPSAQQWKQQPLIDTGYGAPDWLRLVPVDFEAGANRMVYERARAAGTPFVSFFSPGEMLALARGDAGFRDARCVSAEDLTQRYFDNRSDRLRPSSGETFLVART